MRMNRIEGMPKTKSPEAQASGTLHIKQQVQNKHLRKPGNHSGPYRPAHFYSPDAAVSCHYDENKRGNRLTISPYESAPDIYGCNPAYFSSPDRNLSLITRSMSSVIRGRSHSGFQPHSSRAQLSSSLSGQLRAIDSLTGSTS